MRNIRYKLQSVHKKIHTNTNRTKAETLTMASPDLSGHADHVTVYSKHVIGSSDHVTGYSNHITGYSDHRSTFNKPKFRLWLLLLILGFCSFSSYAIRANAQHDQNLQKGIANEIIRFHVLANSDSDEDQQLKLKVKGAVVEALAPILKDATSVAEARSLLNSNLDLIKSTALKTIQENGYSYPVSVTLEKTYFPLKIYGEFTFPPGTYEALRVQIGEAQGQNWWCVMFPQLCFIDSTYSIVDKESEKKLQRLLTDEEYESLINKKTPVKVKFKILEQLKDLFS